MSCVHLCVCTLVYPGDGGLVADPPAPFQASISLSLSTWTCQYFSVQRASPQCFPRMRHLGGRHLPQVTSRCLGTAFGGGRDPGHCRNESFPPWDVTRLPKVKR